MPYRPSKPGVERSRPTASTPLRALRAAAGAAGVDPLARPRCRLGKDRWIDPPCEKAGAGDLRGRGYEYAPASRVVSLAVMYVQPSSEPDRRHRTPPARRVEVRSPIRITDTWPDDLPITTAEVRAVEAWLGEVLDEVFGPRL